MERVQRGTNTKQKVIHHYKYLRHQGFFGLHVK